MLSLPHLMTALMLAGGMSLWSGAASPAETRVDLALVLAVDVSFSMEPDEQDLQRQGLLRRSVPRFIRRSARACWGASW